MTAPQQSSSSEQAQAAQAGLAAVVASALLQAFPGLDLTDSRTVQLFTLTVQAIVQKYSSASAVLATRAYSAARASAGVSAPFTPAPGSVPSADDVQAAVEWAVRDLIVPEPDPALFQDAMTSSAQKLVQDVGRTTIIDNVREDREATAWARIPEPTHSKSGTCAFCALLATRGAVYKADTAKFKAHPNCQCHAEPIFGRYEPSHQIRQWQGLYKQHVTDAGRKGADGRAAFRQAIEDRPVTGLTKGPNAPKRLRTAGPGPKPVTATPEQADRLIQQFEQSNRRAAGNPKLAAMVKANDARIAELRKLIAQPLGV